MKKILYLFGIFSLIIQATFSLENIQISHLLSFNFDISSKPKKVILENSDFYEFEYTKDKVIITRHKTSSQYGIKQDYITKYEIVYIKDYIKYSEWGSTSENNIKIIKLNNDNLVEKIRIFDLLYYMEMFFTYKPNDISILSKTSTWTDDKEINGSIRINYETNELFLPKNDIFKFIIVQNKTIRILKNGKEYEVYEY